MTRFITLVASALSFGVCLADLLDCGPSRYDPSQYTCYPGNILCPKVNGDATLPCGTAPPACYSPLQYSCTKNQLATKAVYNGPFTVKASAPGAPFDGLEMNACGRHFNLNGSTCSYCPDIVKQQGGTCPPGTRTVLYDGGMDTEVPGGQIYYIEPTGALGFSQAHSASYPTGSLFGITVYQDGGFIYLPGEGWLACPGDKGVWQVLQKLDGVAYTATCLPFNAVAVPYTGETPAWQYT